MRNALLSRSVSGFLSGTTALISSRALLKPTVNQTNVRLLTTTIKSHAPATTHASQVIVDVKNVSQLRDKLAREQLTDNLPEQRILHVTKGLRLTVPYIIKIIVPFDSQEKAKADCERVIDDVMTVIDEQLNNWNDQSEIGRINNSPSLEEHKLSDNLREVVECVWAVHRLSGGTFDPSVEPLARYIVQNTLNPTRMTPENAEEFKKIMAYTNLFDSWVFDAKAGTLKKRNPYARLDLGGVNKGRGVDMVCEKLKALNYKDFFFDWGGDCRACGRSPSDEGWAVGVVRPPDLENLQKPLENPMLLRVIMLDNEALATSGDYENLYEVDGMLFNKTADPRTGQLLQPSNEQVAQITVKNKSCMYADALATASLVKGEIQKIRHMLDGWRQYKFSIKDYVAYVRKGERVAHMYEIAKESWEQRRERIKTSLPARIIVVGGGLAGLSAAVEAATAGASVVIMEKYSRVGGNSAKATSGINGWGTDPQAEKGIMDDTRYFERDTYLSGKGGECKHGLIKILSVKSGDAVHWLTKNFGIPLSVLSQLGGHSRPRTHRAPDRKDGAPLPIGFTIMRHMEEYILNKLADRVTIMTECAVTDLISTSRPGDNGQTISRVVGVKYKTSSNWGEELCADAVVLATGGFGNDHTENSLLNEFAPQLINYPTTNGDFATGDGVKMARRLNAKLVDMDKLQLHPTGLINPSDPTNPTKYLGPEALRGSGGILVNGRGKRFVNELDLRSVVSKAITAQGDIYPESNNSSFAYCVLNENAVNLFGRAALGFYQGQGLFQEAGSLTELAGLIGCDEENLKTTLQEYKTVSESKDMDTLTGKIVYPCVLGPEGRFWVAVVTPSIHYSMGGISITPFGEVLTWDDTAAYNEGYPIEGLFGAGEVTGGVHGGNRLGGNSLLECVVFGRLAGDRAATILQRHSYGLSNTHWNTVVLSDVRDGGIYGRGSRTLVFNLPGSLQSTGLKLGQFIAIRGEWDGEHLMGYYSPISLPTRLGSICMLTRVDRGNHREWMQAMTPGIAIEMKACGGLAIDTDPITGIVSYQGRQLRQIAMIAGGSGIAPMLQLIRTCSVSPYCDQLSKLSLIYAAETEEELTYRDFLDALQNKGDLLKFHVVLNNPPPGWTEGVGLIDDKILSKYLPVPTDDVLVVVCGPPVMQKAIFNMLERKGWPMDIVKSVDGEM